jgi:membrane fusion protein (multidrug efflux system)
MQYPKVKARESKGCMTPGVYADLDELIRLLKWMQKWTRLLIRPFLWALHLQAVPLALHLFSNSIFRGDHDMNAKQNGRSWVRSVTFSKVLLVAVLSCLTVAPFGGCKKGQKAAPPPTLVEVINVLQKDVPVHFEWIGTADGLVNATIRAQVMGYLIKQNYREGEFVEKGQVLFEIDPRPFQVTLDQARASLDQAKASLEQAKAEVAREEARYSVSKANLARVRPLAEQNAVSKKDLDDAIGAEESNQAAVLAAQAAVVAAQAAEGVAKAAVDKAQLDVDFTKLTSPVAGIAGIAKAQIGNLVGPGQLEELTTVSTVDPIKVYISVSEQEYMKAMEVPGAARKMPLELILADGRLYPYKGEFALADRQVDVKTGTIRVGALFKNPGNILRPGQFARVRALINVKKNALLVPQRAVTELQGTYQVAVVGPDNKVDIRPVKAAERVDLLWVIDEGLKPGERVVVEGIQKVRQGMPVTPKPFGVQVPPQPEATSKPQEKHPEPEKTKKR